MDNCDIVRDLLPLYVDGVCGEASRRLVEEHVASCPACAKMLSQLKNSVCEESLRREAYAVLAPRRWRNRAFAASCALAAFASVPACLLAQTMQRGEDKYAWLLLLAPALLVVMSATLLPLRTRRYTGRWTVLGYGASLMLLCMACAVYVAEGAAAFTSGTVFFLLVSTALGGVFAFVVLPWAAKDESFLRRSGDLKRAWGVAYLLLLADTFCLTRPIFWLMGAGWTLTLVLLGVTAGILYRRLRIDVWARLGLCVTVVGSGLAWLVRPLLVLTGAEKNVVRAAQIGRAWLAVGSALAGAALVALGAWRAYRRSVEKEA